MFLLTQSLVGLALPDFPIVQLPYLLLTDDDLRRLPIPSLQPTWGLLALWVTGRAMELARELFALWGYRRVDEVVWVKTGQLGGLVRTGRTGHWLK
jgi:mRNA (2'-O-methyladenosine-N6-)-methyltransferase